MVVKEYRFHGETIPADELEPVDPYLLPKGYEMVDNQLVEMPDMGAEASWVASKVHFRLSQFLEAHPLGVAVTAEFSYKCFPKFPGLIRKPDVSVILCDPETYVPPRVNSIQGPALIVEVISPNNKVTEISEKVDEFLDAGTAVAWVIDPELRRAFIYQASDRDTIRQIREPGTISGEPVLPGFSLSLAQILPRIPSTSENEVSSANGITGAKS